MPVCRLRYFWPGHLSAHPAGESAQGRHLAQLVDNDEGGTMTKATSEAAHPASVGIVGRYRWVIVALLFAAMVINYVDRQTIGLLKPDLSRRFGWSETDYADLVFYFQLS